jgi:hypothetical protein
MYIWHDFDLCMRILCLLYFFTGKDIRIVEKALFHILSYFFVEYLMSKFGSKLFLKVNVLKKEDLVSKSILLSIFGYI